MLRRKMNSIHKKITSIHNYFFKIKTIIYNSYFNIRDNLILKY
jgi:hypothetical protein